MEYITLIMASFSLFEGEFRSTNIFITLSPLGSALRTTLLDVCNVCGQFSTRLPQQPFYFPAQRSERNNSNNYARAILLTHKSFETEAETQVESQPSQDSTRVLQENSLRSIIWPLYWLFMLCIMYSNKLSWYLLDHINRYCFSWWQRRVMVEKGLGILYKAETVAIFHLRINSLFLIQGKQNRLHFMRLCQHQF